MTEINITGSNRTYSYAADEQGEHGSLMIAADEREADNPDESDARLKALAEDFEDLLYPPDLDQLL
jgi:hypothetical protein